MDLFYRKIELVKNGDYWGLGMCQIGMGGQVEIE